MEKNKKYQIKDTKLIANETRKIRKILYIIVAIFLAIVAIETNKSYASEATITQGDMEITWEYTVSGSNAQINEIKEVKINGVKVIPSEISNDEYTSESNVLGTLTIPSTINGYTVTQIGNGSTRIINPDVTHKLYEESIEKLVIPSTVTSIAPYAFENCTSIKKVTFGDNLRTIGDYAFRNAIRLNSSGSSTYTLQFPNSLQTIGKGAFELNAQYNFQTKNGATRVSEAPTNVCGWSQWGYASLSTFRYIQFGTGLTTIGDFAFAGSLITNVNVPSNITSIGTGAFAKSKWLKNITIAERQTALTVNDFAFSELDKGIETLTIPTNLTLKSYVFANNPNLKTVILQSGVNTIANAEFYNCTALTDIQHADAITSIGSYGLARCESITTAEYNDIVSANTSIESYAFSHCTGLTGTIELNVGSNTNYAFEYCTNIEKVIINNNYSAMPRGIFYHCEKLSEITMPSKTNYTVQELSFAYCKSLTIDQVNNTILPGTKEIGKSAFEGCTGFAGKLILPSTLQIINASAFSGDNGITEIEFNQGLQKISSRAFWELNKIPEIITLPSSVTTVETEAFYQVREVFFGNQQSSVSTGNRWYGMNDVIVHYNNHKHNVDVTCTLPGVKLINTQTGETFNTGNYACGSNYNLQVVVEEGYSYPDLAVKIVSYGQYASSDVIRQFAELDSDNKFNLNNIVRDEEEGIIRDLQVIVQKSRVGTDLVLREFITQVNGENIADTRIPDISISRQSTSVISSSPVKYAQTISYSHSKDPVIVNKNDTVTYKIRVYNEGESAGKVNSVRVYLQKGLKLAENNTTNSQYNWSEVETTDEGTIISSDYLSEKSIVAYIGEGKPQYEDLEVVCEVTTEDTQYLTAIAELSESNDIDSQENSIKLSNLASSHLVANTEDDSDFERIKIKDYTKIGYKIVIEKYDETTLTLLNGAKFNLYDKDMNLLESNVTADRGRLEFEERVSYGEGIDTYFIEEVGTPAGYTKTFEGLIEVIVEKAISSSGASQITVTCELQGTALTEDKKVTNLADSDFANLTIESMNIDYQNEDNYIPIYTSEQLAYIKTEGPHTIEGREYQFVPGAYYKLMNDISLPPTWESIELYGTLDGNGHAILGTVIPFSNVAGYVKNLTVNGGINANNLNGAGLLASRFTGKITNCKAGTVSSYISNNSGTSGGFIGQTYGTTIIENCTNYATVRVTDNSRNGGGIVGISTGMLKIVNCKNEALNDSNIFYGSDLGGILGRASSGKVKIVNSSNNQRISGASNIGGILGKVDGAQVQIEKCTNSGAIYTGSYNGGGIVGYNQGLLDISECTNEKAENYPNGETSGYIAGNYNIGGIVGGNIANMSIYKSTNNAFVYTSNYSGGGLLGKTEGGFVYIMDSNNNAKVYGGSSNAGGIIGFVQAYANITNSKNTGYVKASYNAGGMVGYVQGTVDLYQCENDGEVEAPTYNAGGFVGGATIGATGNELIKSGYANNTITISLGNRKSITGSYNLVIEKIDILQGIYLEGATFDIYDENMNIIQKDAIAEDGKIKITDILIDSLISDVYYIKETKAPEGYDIRVKDFVKVVITKKWNSEKLKYEVDIEPSVTTEQTETKDKGTITDTQIQSSFIGSSAVRRKPPRIRVTQGLNKGAITSYSASSFSNGSAGGIIGTIYGYADIYDTTNLGKIKAVEQAGGIIGLSGSPSNGMMINITRCTNGSEEDSTLGELEVTYYHGAIGGIIGITANDTVINDCYNYANLQTNVAEHLGGIVGVSDGRRLHIYDSANYGNLTSTSSNGIEDVGGIVATQYGTDFSGIYNIMGNNISKAFTELKVLKCESTGDISANTARIGGIVSAVTSGGTTNIVYISECKVEGASENNRINFISQSHNGANTLGPILGIAAGATVEVSNNKVKNVAIDLKDGYYVHTGGLIGKLGWMSNGNGTIYSITVNNNTVENIKILGETKNTNININGANIGGLVGMIQTDGNNERKPTSISSQITFDNNTIKDSYLEYKNTEKMSCLAGLAGKISAPAAVTITNCQVVDTNILNDNTGYDSSTGGLLGIVTAGSVNISNCEVKSTKEEKGYIRLGMSATVGSPLGGLIGTAYVTYSTSIENCKLTNMEVKFTENDAGECALGGVIGWASSQVVLRNVELNDVNVESELTTSMASIGGFVGYMDYENLVVNNCKFNNGIIAGGFTGTSATAGGITGYAQRTNVISGVELNNIKFIRNNYAISGNGTFGSIGGMIGNSANSNTTISNSKINNLEVELPYNTGVTTLGGVIGVGSATIDNVELSQIKFDCDMSRDNGYAAHAVGGIFGYGSGSIANSTVDGFDVKANKSIIGGIAGITSGTLKNNKVKNVTIEVTTRENEASLYDYGYAFAGLVAVYTGNTVEDCSVENLKITTPEFNYRFVHAGGFIGVAKSDVEITNSTEESAVKGFEVNNNTDTGIVGGIIAVIRDTDDYDVYENNLEPAKAKISGVTVEDFTANGNYAIGGIVGTGISTIKNSIVSNMNTLVEDEAFTNEKDTTVVGGIAGIQVEDSEFENVTVNSNSILKSNSLSGGIAGIASGFIKKALVENIEVHSTKGATNAAEVEPEELPEELENPESSTEDKTEEFIKDSIIGAKANAIAPQSLSEFVECVIRNVIVKNGSASVVVNQE